MGEITIKGTLIFNKMDSEINMQLKFLFTTGLSQLNTK